MWLRVPKLEDHHTPSEQPPGGCSLREENAINPLWVGIFITLIIIYIYTYIHLKLELHLQVWYFSWSKEHDVLCSGPAVDLHPRNMKWLSTKQRLLFTFYTTKQSPKLAIVQGFGLAFTKLMCTDPTGHLRSAFGLDNGNASHGYEWQLHRKLLRSCCTKGHH